MKMALKINPSYTTGWEVLAEMYEDMGMLDEMRLVKEKIRRGLM